MDENRKYKKGLYIYGCLRECSFGRILKKKSID